MYPPARVGPGQDRAAGRLRRNRFSRLQLPPRRPRSTRSGIPVVYYVSPQLWAWRSGPDPRDEAFVAKVLPIFPFEVEIYERAGIPVEFVGHPLVDLIGVTHAARGVPARRRASIRRRRRLRSLPGSRPNEVRATLPVLAAAMPRIRAGACRTCSSWWRARPSCRTSLLRSARRRAPDGVAIVEGRTDDVLHACDVGADRVGHRHGADRAAREADGDRLPAVAADLPAGAAVREGRTPSAWRT